MNRRRRDSADVRSHIPNSRASSSGLIGRIVIVVPSGRTWSWGDPSGRCSRVTRVEGAVVSRPYDRTRAAAESRLEALDDAAILEDDLPVEDSDEAEGEPAPPIEPTLGPDDYGFHEDDPEVDLLDDDLDAGLRNDEEADALDAVAEVFNARDLDQLLTIMATDGEVPGLLGYERANLGSAIEDLWQRRPTCCITRGHHLDEHVGVLWGAPPCRAGRCRCRTSGSARTTGSRRRSRRSRSSPGSTAGARAAVEGALREPGTTRVAVVDEHRRPVGVGVARRRQAAEVPPVAQRQQRQHPDRGVLRGVQRPGHAGGGSPAAPAWPPGSRTRPRPSAAASAAGRGRRARAPRRCRSAARRSRSPAWSPRPAEATSTSPHASPVGPRGSRTSVSERGRVVTWLAGVLDERDVLSRSSLAPVGPALVQVDRPGVDLPVGAASSTSPITAPVPTSTIRTARLRRAQPDLRCGARREVQ
jgi:hypothetical protein